MANRKHWAESPRGRKTSLIRFSCKTLGAILPSNDWAKPSQILALNRDLSGGFVTKLLLQTSFKTALPVDAKHAAHSANAFPTAGSHFIKTHLFIIVSVILKGYCPRGARAYDGSLLRPLKQVHQVFISHHARRMSYCADSWSSEVLQTLPTPSLGDHPGLAFQAVEAVWKKLWQKWSDLRAHPVRGLVKSL